MESESVTITVQNNDTLWFFSHLLVGGKYCLDALLPPTMTKQEQKDQEMIQEVLLYLLNIIMCIINMMFYF